MMKAITCDTATFFYQVKTEYSYISNMTCYSVGVKSIEGTYESNGCADMGCVQENAHRAEILVSLRAYEG